MISYKRDVLERQSLSEVKMGRGSPIYERVRKKIMEYFKNNVPQRQIAKALQISSSTVHNIIKTFRETGDLCWMLGPSDDTASLIVIDITKWAQEYFQKPLSVNTIRRAICRCQLKLYHVKRKTYVNMVQKRRRVLWAKAHLKWTVSKWKSVLLSDESKFDILVGNHGRRVLRAKEEEDLPACYQCSVQKPASLMVWGCISAYGMGRHYECWKVYKGFRARYAPLQTTSISGKTLCISVGQCKAPYCSYYNSMAP